MNWVTRRAGKRDNFPHWYQHNLSLFFSSTTKPKHILWLYPLPSSRSCFTIWSVCRNPILLPLLLCSLLIGNFIGKGGAHADGTKSSGDKVPLSPVAYAAVHTTNSFTVLPTLSGTVSNITMSLSPRPATAILIVTITSHHLMLLQHN